MKWQSIALLTVVGVVSGFAIFSMAESPKEPFDIADCELREIEAEYAIYLAEAKKGNTCAMYNVAWLHHTGGYRFKAEKSDAKAVEWLTRAAESGLPDAQNDLGYRHINGWRIPKPIRAEGIKWYQAAIDQGHREALYSVAQLYDYGNRGFPQKRSDAVFLYRMAAKQGHEPSLMRLAYMYADGIAPLDQNFERALALMQEAGESFGRALYRVSFTFFNSGDYETAKLWMQRAAEQGSSEARVFLSKFDAKVQDRERAKNREYSPIVSKTSGYDLLLGLIKFGVALNSIAPDQSNWSEEQRQRAYAAEQERLTRMNNNTIDVGWAMKF
uniref:tetratricopeptide repeat protein n=1 Tax=Roseovarius indicus TaxID=540747 RepID=UPI003B521F9B